MLVLVPSRSESELEPDRAHGSTWAIVMRAGPGAGTWPKVTSVPSRSTLLSADRPGSSTSVGPGKAAAFPIRTNDGPEEGIEPFFLGAAGDGQLVVVGCTLLGLDKIEVA